MRRQLLVVFLLLCIGLPPGLAARRRGAKLYPGKETTADMRGMNRIFLGWIDMKEDAWALYGYSSKEEWASMVTGLNSQFLGLCQTKLLGGKTVVGARDKGDEDAGGEDARQRSFEHFHQSPAPASLPISLPLRRVCARMH